MILFHFVAEWTKLCLMLLFFLYQIKNANIYLIIRLSYKHEKLYQRNVCKHMKWSITVHDGLFLVCGWGAES